MVKPDHDHLIYEDNTRTLPSFIGTTSSTDFESSIHDQQEPLPQHHTHMKVVSYNCLVLGLLTALAGEYLLHGMSTA